MKDPKKKVNKKRPLKKKLASKKKSAPKGVAKKATSGKKITKKKPVKKPSKKKTVKKKPAAKKLKKAVPNKRVTKKRTASIKLVITKFDKKKAKDYTIPVLRGTLKKYHLKVSGNKSDLIKRLVLLQKFKLKQKYMKQLKPNKPLKGKIEKSGGSSGPNMMTWAEQMSAESSANRSRSDSTSSISSSRMSENEKYLKKKGYRIMEPEFKMMHGIVARPTRPSKYDNIPSIPMVSLPVIWKKYLVKSLYTMARDLKVAPKNKLATRMKSRTVLRTQENSTVTGQTKRCSGGKDHCGSEGELCGCSAELDFVTLLQVYDNIKLPKVATKSAQKAAAAAIRLPEVYSDLEERVKYTSGYFTSAANQKKYPERRVYVSGAHGKRGIHDGQRKLLMSEIYFLTKYAKDGDTVVYAGAAPGTHILILLKMFPTLDFVLIDPNFNEQEYRQRDASDFEEGVRGESLLSPEQFAAFVYRMRRSKKVTFSPGLFVTTKDDKKSIRGATDSAEDYAGKKNVLFISDVRINTNKNAELSKQEFEMRKRQGKLLDMDHKHQSPLNVDIHNDNLLQMKWVTVMKPRAAMLKFTIPYEGDEYEKEKFFDGELYLQPWSGQSSSETRVITDGSKEKMYDREEYEEKFAHHNRVTRFERRGKYNWRHVCNIGWDQARELQIIYEWALKYKKNGNPDRNVAKIFDMIQENLALFRPTNKNFEAQWAERKYR